MAAIVVSVAACNKEEENNDNDDNGTTEVPTATNTSDPTAAAEAEAKVIGGWTFGQTFITPPADYDNDGDVDSDVTTAYLNDIGGACEVPDLVFDGNGAFMEATPSGCPSKTDTTGSGTTFSFLNGNQLILTRVDSFGSSVDTNLVSVSENSFSWYAPITDSLGNIMFHYEWRYTKL